MKNIKEKYFKTITYLVISIILTLGLSISFQSLLAAWQAPSQSPPNGNVSAPIYADSAVNQTISTGGLTVAGGVSTPNLSVQGWISSDGGNEGINIDNSGNVGVGTANPGGILDLATSDEGARNTNEDALILTRYDTGSAAYNGFGNSILFQGETYRSNSYLPHARIKTQIRDNSVDTYGVDMSFELMETDTSATPVERMRIKYNGNVGIGTADPFSTLHVYSNSDDVTWPLVVNNARNNSTVSGYGTGIKLKQSNNGETGKWVGIASIQETAYSNDTGMAFFTDGEHERVRIDASGNVGVGITNPRSTLDVGGGISIGSGNGVSTTHGSRRSLQLLTDTNYGGTYDNHSGYLMYSTMPGGWGTAQLNFAHSNNWGSYDTADPSMIVEDSGVTARAFVYSSDRRLKENIKPVKNALDRILDLEGVSFDWKKDGRNSLGLIAQDVEKIFPELVHTNESTGFKSVEYGNLVSPLVEAIKEQQKQIEELKLEIEKLK